jgi:ParB family chromosome partitioning protein
MDNKALGKGLSALIPEKKVRLDIDDVQSEQKQTQNGQVVHLDVVSIDYNSFQPRQEYDLNKLEKLKSSIEERGVLQPILVRAKSNGRYEVIAGERRLRAVQLLKLPKIPVIVRELTDHECLVLALIENVQREDLNPIEEAMAYKRLVEEFSFTQDEISKSVSKDRSTVSNLMRLLKLPDYIQFSLSKGDISVGHARALLSINDDETRGLYFQRVLEKNLSVRELEDLVQKIKLSDPENKKKKDVKKIPELLDLEDQLQLHFGTKVKISRSAKRGKIVLEYYTKEDLDRIIRIMKHHE